MDIEQLIINKLAGKYGAGCKYYFGENIPSDLKKPCFIVSTPSDDLDMELNTCGWYNAIANVVYIPPLYSHGDMRAKRLELLVLLQDIEGAHGSSVSCREVDESLSATASYRTYVDTTAATALTMMETMIKE